MSGQTRIPLHKAMGYADRFMEKLWPYCLKADVAGSVRRQVPMVGDVEIVVVPDPMKDLATLFPIGYPGMVVNGPRLKRFKYVDLNLQIELYITRIEDWGRIFAIRTGSSAFSHYKLAVTWNRLGFCGTSDGLRRKAECDHKSTWKVKKDLVDITMPPVFDSEMKFFDFLEIPWIQPTERNWKTKDEDKNYSYIDR